MDRKWRTNRPAYHTALSFPDFEKIVNGISWRNDYELASLTDLYAVYIMLHIEGQEWELSWSPDGEFYYFVAKRYVEEGAEDAVIHAPEGDEDAPEVVPEDMADAAVEAVYNTKQEDMKASDTEAADVKDSNTNDKINSVDGFLTDEGRGGSEESKDEDAIDNAEESFSKAVVDGKTPPECKPKGRIRTQLVIPVSSSCMRFSPRLLQKFFSVRGVSVQQVILALVDANATVSRCCLYNYIQPPLEGPGTATLEMLLDD